MGTDFVLAAQDAKHRYATKDGTWTALPSTPTTTLVTATEAGLTLPNGLAYDGTYIYWGNDNGAGVNGTIYKINPSTGATVSSFAGPPHAADGTYAPSRGTLFFSSGGAEVPVVWEINPTTGALVRSWSFSGLDYNRGLLFAWDDTNHVAYLTTSSTSNQLKWHNVTLNNDGSYVDNGTVFTSSSDNGLPQGTEWYQGHLYYLSDDPSVATTNVRRITRFALVNGLLVVDRVYGFGSGAESEGIFFYNGLMCYGDANKVIRVCDWQPYAPRLYVENLIVATSKGFAMPPNAGGSEIVAYYLNTVTTSHTGVAIDSRSGKDAYLLLGENGAAKWDIRRVNTSNNIQLRTQTDNTVRFTFDRSGNLTATGGLTTALTSKTGTYTITSSDSVVLCNGTFTVTLPSGTTAGAGRRYVIKNTGAGTITVAATAGTVEITSLAAGVGHYYVSDGTNWWAMV